MIIFISGSFPYAPDGISDGARILFDSLKKRSINEEFMLLTTRRFDIVQCLEENQYSDYVLLDDWKLRIRNIKQIARITKNASIVHMEYPGTYYGKTLLASFIPLIIRLNNLKKKKKTIVCTRLHEYSDARLLRKIAIIPIALFSHYLYIPALVDRTQLERIINKKKIKPTVIGSNIPVTVTEIKRTTGPFVVTYFGAVYPGKGIEKMLHVWKKVMEQKGLMNIVFRFIGDIGIEETNQFKEYHLSVLKLIDALGLRNNITITGYLSDIEVANEISNSDVATLFFDDGLTLRRGSFLAFLSHGIPIVTSKGDLEAQEMFGNAKGIFMSEDIELCAKKVVEFLKCEPHEKEKMMIENKDLSHLFSWDSIADNFISDYKRYIGAPE